MTTQITLQEFQSFDKDGAGVRDAKRINVLVGPNNVGKSKILRAIDRTIRDYKSSLIFESQAPYTITIQRALNEGELKAIFPPGTHNPYTGGDYWENLGKWVTQTRVTVQLRAEKGFVLQKIEPVLNAPPEYMGNRHKLLRHAEERIRSHVSESTFERFSSPVHYIAAERDVKAEGEKDSDAINADGTGVTNLLRRLTRTVGQAKHSVEVDLLRDLNALLWPDHQFTRIDVLQHQAQKVWEIFLEEKGKGLVPLSQCGSGLRTLIHLLTYTNVIAKRSGGKIKAGTFLFEELENCLHPHVQRNLFAYLDDLIEYPARVFLTTHSSVCLDYFQGHDDVVLTHVYQTEGKTRSRTVEAFRDRCGVLDRMGSRASDALQTNAVLWVEGPSDRTFVKHWMKLCGSELREGRDFSIMFYGGDLLSHLTMDAEQEVQEYIRLLKINRNSAIIIDSDKTYQGGQLRETKRRVKEEAEAEGQFVWITNGKEIENYIAPSFFERMFDPAPVIERYSNPWKQLHGLQPIDYPRAINTKVEFAEFLAKNSAEADFHLDWEKQTISLLKFIREANGLVTK